MWGDSSLWFYIFISLILVMLSTFLWMLAIYMSSLEKYSFVATSLVWWSSVCVFVLLLPLLLISYPKNHHQDQSQGAYGFFIVPALFFKYLIHFELDIMYGIWYNFILLHVPVQLFFSEPFIEETLHFLLCSFGFVVKLIDRICMSLFLGSLSSPIDLCVYFWSNIMLFWLLLLCNNSLNHGKRCLWLVCSLFGKVS